MLRRYGTGVTCPEGHRAARGRLGMASAGTNFDAGQGTQPAPSRQPRGGGRTVATTPQGTRRVLELDARALREQGMSYQQIGEALGVGKTSAYRLCGNKVGQSTRAQKAASEERHRKACADCGGPMSMGSAWRDNRLCRACLNVVNARRKHTRREQIHAMWHDGLMLREIAERLDSSKAAIGAEVTKMRRDGWDMPYRKPGPRPPVAA